MSIGERLKKEREKKGYSLDEVHSRLRIHPQILLSIEENRFGELPAPIYTKGFIRRYSEFLELNPQEAIAEYEGLNIKERVALEIPPQSRETAAASQALAKKSAPWTEHSGPLVIRAAVFFVTVVVIWMSVGAVWNAWTNRRGREAKTAVSTAAPSAPAARPAPAAAPSQKRQGVINAPLAGTFPKISSKEPIRLTISAHKDAWTKVLADENTVFESILKPGQSREWSATGVFEIKMGRPDGITLTVNGMNLGSPAGGQATHIRITRNGVERIR